MTRYWTQPNDSTHFTNISRFIRVLAGFNKSFISWGEANIIWTSFMFLLFQHVLCNFSAIQSFLLCETVWFVPTPINLVITQATFTNKQLCCLQCFIFDNILGLYKAENVNIIQSACIWDEFILQIKQDKHSHCSCTKKQLNVQPITQLWRVTNNVALHLQHFYSFNATSFAQAGL